ncbi:MAG: caspase family protein [bacterium]
MRKTESPVSALYYAVLICFVSTCCCFYSAAQARDRDLSISPRVNSSSQQQVAKQGEYWALIIGINNYENWALLQTALADATAVREVLIKNYGFSEKKTVFLKDREATRQNILREFRKMVEVMKEDDSLFIYYAGHGYLDKLLNVGYWVPCDGKATDISTFIPNSTIHDLVKAAKSKHIYLVSDSCFSGSLFLRAETPSPATIDDRYIKKYGGLKSRQVLSSGNMEPVSDSGYDNHSIFAYYFIKTLKENPDPYLTPMGIFERLKVPMARNANQIPICKPLQDAYDEGGEFIFANLALKNHPGKLSPLQQPPSSDLEVESEKEKVQQEAEQLQQQKKQLEELRKALLEQKALINEQKGVAEEKARIEQQLKEIQLKQGAVPVTPGQVKQKTASVQQETIYQVQKPIEPAAGKTYFTRVNIWYEKPDQIPSTNYHRGARLPVGTKVTIRQQSNGKIRFAVDGASTVYTLVYIPKHGRMTMEEFFSHYFSEENVMAEGGKFSQFTPEEQDNIKHGTLAEGMCKEAVLMAYGYPPKHKTPNISNNVWIFWENNHNKIVVTFQDNKIANIKD